MVTSDLYDNTHRCECHRSKLTEKQEADRRLSGPPRHSSTQLLRCDFKHRRHVRADLLLAGHDGDGGFRESRRSGAVGDRPQLLGREADEADELNVGRVGHHAGLAGRLGDGRLERLVGGARAVGELEGDAVDLVGAGADHLVENVTSFCKIANDDADVVGDALKPMIFAGCSGFGWRSGG